MNTENNMLIAKFMKLPEHGETEYLHENGVYDSFSLRYHSSWDWLMPVIDKIESLGYDSRIHGNNSDGGFLCDFVNSGNEEIAIKVSYESKIEAVYYAVIDFIKWHNTQPK